MREFLASLGIKSNGEITDDDRYVVTIKDSDTYAQIFAVFERSNQLHQIDPNKMDFNLIRYESEKYDIYLYSDYDMDKYRIEMREKVEF